jgi:PleD family two-component response regulator
MAELQGPNTQAADILVVDDEAPSLQRLAEILARAGYRVRPVERPQVALEAALAHSPSLILLDARMPNMNDLELCQRLSRTIVHARCRSFSSAPCRM